jgi:SAM-dependent methyltransferase
MENNEYETMYNIEENYWWYVGLRKLVFSSIKRLIQGRKNQDLLDAGCGTGKILENCKTFNAYGLDFSEESIRFCKKRKITNLLRASISDIPLKSETFDLVISLDVLCNIEKDNNLHTLKEIRSTMKDNAILILNLPAYNYLQSKHDKAVHIKHRYTIKDLRDIIYKAGFKIEKITYRNTFIFPIVFIKRIMENKFFMNTGEVESELKPLPSWFNKILTNILYFENFLIKSGVNFPFGLSVYCIARKK